MYSAQLAQTDSMSSLPTTIASESFAPLGARRLLLLGGIGLIIVGMIVGDIFAVFILHQNASRVGASLAGAAHAALAGDAAAARSHFQDVGAFLENRGTKVDTHVHMIDFGYLALLLAILEPWIAFSSIMSGLPTAHSKALAGPVSSRTSAVSSSSWRCSLSSQVSGSTSARRIVNCRKTS